MDSNKILVKDLDAYVRSYRALFSQRGRKRVYVTLHAAPGVARYVVADGDNERGFIKKGDAVRYFNELGTAK